MSELSPNPLSTPPAAAQAGAPEETTSQLAASAQPNLDTQPTPQPIADFPSRPKLKREFPPYTRSLLRVRVPIVVTLAEKKQTLGRILEIGPGQIIQFEKSCEETLDLEASNCKIACGEAVKVGDKFGLRITSIVPPEERFLPVRK